MSALAADLGPYLALILAGFLPTEVWRWLGLVAARGLEEDSEIVVWSRAVATAILAAVIAQLILTGSGALGAIPFAVRAGAIVAGFAAYLAIRRSVFTGVAVGELALLAGTWALQ
jgi:hypothetical protein